MPSFRLPLAVLLGAIACWLALVVTEPPGPGLDPDAVSYIGAARSLVASGSLLAPDDGWDAPDSTSPLAHFPPGLPAALAIPMAAGLPPLQSGRLVNAIAALVLITVTAWVVMRTTTSRTAGAAAAIVVMATPAISDQFQNVLSEPLFLALAVVLLALMTLRPDRPLAAGFVAAAAAMVRYAGIALIGAAAVWWLLQAGPRRTRVRRAALAIAPGAVGCLAWVMRVIHASRAAEIRELSVYGQIAPTLREGLATAGSWLAPQLGGVARALAAMAIAAVSAWIVVAALRTPSRDAAGGDDRTSRDVRSRTLIGATGVMAVCYIGLVVASRLFADPGIPLDARLLSPVMLLGAIAVVTAAGTCWVWWGRRARAAACAVIALWSVASGASAVSDALDALDTGNDFAASQWTTSPLIAWVREHAAGRTVYTNYPTALYFEADRLARELPQSTGPDTVAALERQMTDDRGVLVVFDQPSAFTPPPQPLLAKLPLRELVRTHDGAAYELAR